MVETAVRGRSPRGEVGTTNSTAYSSKIIKAGALLADTKTLLAHWNTAVPARVNLDRLRRENVLGKASRSRVEDVLTIFRQRFLGEECVMKAVEIEVTYQGNRFHKPGLPHALHQQSGIPVVSVLTPAIVRPQDPHASPSSSLKT
jgi:hypothetical protein